MEQKSDLHWLSELDLGFEELDQLLSEYSLDELQHFAEGYWSGKERYLGKAQWEVRWHTATIIGSTLSPI
ncbi:hypothetical protein [Vibrio owensii]|uniref:hypothetical protein n=1 Tax=Vibrio harveyi group TaxID=717610 RepID=UPI003CC65FCE